MRFARFAATTTVILMLASIAAFAQQTTGEISGRVVNSRDSQPLALVQIELTGTSLRTVTAADGTFRLSEIVPGNYVLQATTVGYYSNRVEFALGPGETKIVEIALTSSTAKRTDTVEVVADVFDEDVEKSASSFTLEGAERKNLASVLADDPLRAVQSLPGVTSNNDFSSEFSVRGAPFSRVGLYLDGVLLHAPFHTTDGQADDGSLTIFNGDLTEAMTLYEGAWPARYSDRTAGILAVDTRQGNRQSIQGQASASASNLGVLLEGPLDKQKRGSWYGNFRKSYLQYILNRIDFGDQPPVAFGFTDAQARIDYDLTPRHAVSLNYLDGASGIDRVRFRDELGINSVMKSGFRFTHLNLGSRYTPSAHWLITNHVAWSGETGSSLNHENATLTDQNYGEWVWRGDFSFSWRQNSSLESGGQFRRPHQSGLARQFVYSPQLTPALDIFRQSANQGGGYVQQTLGFGSNRGRIMVGVRSDAQSGGSPTIVSPYGSVSYQPSSRTSVELDWGEYAQFPELSQLSSVFALHPLLPERAIHYDASIEQRLNERMRLRLEFYDRQDRDLLARPALDPRLNFAGAVVNADPNAELLNSERGYARGFEVFIQRRTENGLTGWISYAYGKTIVSDGALGVDFASDYDQRHTFNAYASRRIRPTVNLSGKLVIGSGMPLPGFYLRTTDGYALSSNRNELRAPAYERIDLRLNKAYVRQRVKTTLFGEIVNVTNHKNRDFDSPGPYDPKTGRTFPNFFSMFPILPSVGMLFEF